MAYGCRNHLTPSKTESLASRVMPRLEVQVQWLAPCGAQYSARMLLTSGGSQSTNSATSSPIANRHAISHPKAVRYWLYPIPLRDLEHEGPLSPFRPALLALDSPCSSRPTFMHSQTLGYIRIALHLVISCAPFSLPDFQRLSCEMYRSHDPFTPHTTWSTFL